MPTVWVSREARGGLWALIASRALAASAGNFPLHRAKGSGSLYMSLHAHEVKRCCSLTPYWLALGRQAARDVQLLPHHKAYREEGDVGAAPCPARCCASFPSTSCMLTYAQPRVYSPCAPRMLQGCHLCSLARDLRFIIIIICIYWRRTGPTVPWGKPRSSHQVPWLTESLIDLLTAIVLLRFNCWQRAAAQECSTDSC